MCQLTVLMPVYNAQKYIAQAIESILNQSFTDFEFIIIDDCSTDKTASIIKTYDDIRIRFFTNERNLGISATLNKGIILATANYIARMDADDISYPQRLEMQFNYLKSNPSCGFVSSLVRVVSEDGRLLRVDDFKSEFYYYNLTFSCWIYHSSVMYRTDVVKSVGMYTEVYSEDYELFWQISRNYKFYNIPEILLDYRVTDHSLHQVLKKEEYLETQQKQVLRNLQFYAGSHYTIPKDYIACLQYSFTPLMKRQNISEIYNCLKQLDFISSKIFEKENINSNLANDIKAAYHKKDFIISFFVNNLSPIKSILLLLRLGRFKSALRKAKAYFSY